MTAKAASVFADDAMVVGTTTLTVPDVGATDLEVGVFVDLGDDVADWDEAGADPGVLETAAVDVGAGLTAELLVD